MKMICQVFSPFHVDRQDSSPHLGCSFVALCTHLSVVDQHPRATVCSLRSGAPEQGLG